MAFCDLLFGFKFFVESIIVSYKYIVITISTIYYCLQVLSGRNVEDIRGNNKVCTSIAFYQQIVSMGSLGCAMVISIELLLVACTWSDVTWSDVKWCDVFHTILSYPVIWVPFLPQTYCEILSCIDLKFSHIIATI